MSTKPFVGEQLDGQILYERQKRVRARQTYLPGPTIVAAGLQTPENVGSVLRLADAAESFGKGREVPNFRPRGAREAATSERLTTREREIVQLIAEGSTSKEIAALLAVSVKTVDAHRANVLRKLRVHSVSQLVLYAIRNHLVQA